MPLGRDTAQVVGRGVFVAQVAARTLQRAGISAPPVDVKGLASYNGITLVPVPNWPGGALDIANNLAANQILTVQEGKGVVGRQPFEH